jgi:hypothetical protein
MIGIDFQSRVEISTLLRLIARLNAIAEMPPIFEPRPGMPQDQFETQVKDALAQLRPRAEARTWFDAYAMGRARVEKMPLALNHGELYFQQMGWAEREDERELAMFDVETMSARPRFTDVASILYPLAGSSGLAEEILFAEYLEVLREIGARGIPDFDQALEELRILRVVGMTESLPWLCRATDEALRGELALKIECLEADLTALGWLSAPPEKHRDA